MNILFKNPSWPKGKWILEYKRIDDSYEIRTESGLFIAKVGPTLIANWLVEEYNKQSEQ